MIDDKIVSAADEIAKRISTNEVGSERLLAYSMHMIDAPSAYVVLRLAFPETKNVDGYTLISERYDSDAFLEWKVKFPNDRRRVESIVNHIHIWDLYKKSGFDRSIDLAILELLHFGWSAWLPQRIGRAVDIACEEGDGAYGPSLTFSVI